MFSSPGLAFLRTRAGSTTISQSAVPDEILNKCSLEDLPDWGSPREVTLRGLPSGFNRLKHTDGVPETTVCPPE